MQDKNGGGAGSRTRVQNNSNIYSFTRLAYFIIVIVFIQNKQNNLT